MGDSNKRRSAIDVPGSLGCKQSTDHRDWKTIEQPVVRVILAIQRDTDQF